MKIRNLLGLVYFTILAVGLSAHAQSTVWTNLAGCNWSDPGNWNPPIPPGCTTNVFLTNYTGNASYTVTSDVPHNTFADLVLINSNLYGSHILLSDTNGFTATGNALIGRNGYLVVSNATVSIVGSVTISNAGAILIKTNAFLNVGGSDPSSAHSSRVTLTNLAGGLIELGRPGVSTAYGIGTLNASTTSVGIVNQGVIRNNTDGHYTSGRIHASIFNDTNGVIATSTLVNRMDLHQVSTNRGRITVANISASLYITNGNVVNEGVIDLPNAGSFVIQNGSLINSSNAQALLFNMGTLSALSTLNYGTMVVSNTSVSGAAPNLGGPVTNYGTLLLYRVAPTVPNGIHTMTASNLVNYGVILAVGTYGTCVTNALAGSVVATPVTNQPGGVIGSTNGSVLVLTSLKNSGTIEVHPLSVFAIGYLGYPIPKKISVGTSSFQNDGIIILKEGNFASLLLTNSSSGTLQGHGEIGHVSLSNLVSASQQTTNFVRHFAVQDVVNAGLIAPEGVLNAGVVFNLPGGKIVGYGILRSIDQTNFYSGETVVSSNLNQEARIHNAAGGTILADGGALTLANGFSSNTQYGLLGATNGGVLWVGDGSQALTNRGVISLSNGRLVCGDLTLINGSISVDLDHLASPTIGLVQAAHLTLGLSSSLTVTGMPTRVVLVRYTGLRTGVLGSIVGLSPRWEVVYGPEADGSITLAPKLGAALIQVQ